MCQVDCLDNSSSTNHYFASERTQSDFIFPATFIFPTQGRPQKKLINNYEIESDGSKMT